jgi:hypothetical protein
MIKGEKMNVAVISSVNLDDKSYIRNILYYIHKKINPISGLIIGNKTLTDKHIVEYASSQELDVRVKIIQMQSAGHQAEFLNNVAIIEESKQVIFIWDGNDSSIYCAIKEAKRKNKEIWIFPCWGQMVSVWQKGKTGYKKHYLQKLLMKLNLSDRVIIIGEESHVIEN